jgi:hypothetical protein
MKIRLVGAELFHADGQTERGTEMTKLIFAFRNIVKRHLKRIKSAQNPLPPVMFLYLSRSAANLSFRFQYILRIFSTKDNTCWRVSVS